MTSERATLRFWAAVVLTAVLVAPAAAQFRGFGPPGRGGPRGGRFGRGFPPGGSRGLLRVLQEDEVQTELKLTDDQKQKVNELAGKFAQPTPEMEELFRSMREASDEERDALRKRLDSLRAARRKELEQELQKVLNPTQFQRLLQIDLQRRGVPALRDDEVAAKLNLSQQQRDKIQQIFESVDQQRRAMFERLRGAPRDERMTLFAELRERSKQLEKQRDEQVLAVLTPQQRQQWQAMLGPPFGEQAKQEATSTTSTPGGAAPSNAGGAAAGSTQPAPTAAPALPVEQVTSVPALPDGTPVPGPVVASFAPRKEGQKAEAPAESPAPQSGVETEQPKPLKKLSFNFRYAPWADVLKLFAEAAGLSLDLNAVPPGTFTYFDDNEYTPTEALNILNGYLLPKGYMIVRRDRFAVVLNVTNGIPPNLVPDVSVDELPKRADNEIVRVVLPLKGKDAATAQQEVQQLLGPQGKVVAMTTTNTLVVTGLVRNVRRVHELLEKYLVEEKSGIQFRAFTLRHIAVTDAERILRDLLGLPKGVQNVSAGATGEFTGSRFGGRFPFAFGGRFGGRGFPGRPPSRESSRFSSRTPTPTPQSTAASSSKVALAADERTNTLLVSAPAEQMEIIDQAIQTIDVAPSGEAGRLAARSSNEPYLEVYTVRNADAAEVTKTLSVLYPGAVVNEDRRYGRIHIYATPSEQREIAALIQRLDGLGGGMKVAVIPTGTLDTATLTTTLQALFANDPDNAPSIVAQPGQLVVRGTADQIAQVQTLLEQLGAGPGSSSLWGGRVRSIDLGGRDPMQVLRLLQTVSPYPIRVRAGAGQPSSGPIREQRVPAARGEIVPPVPERRATESGEGEGSTPVRELERSTGETPTAPANPPATAPEDQNRPEAQPRKAPVRPTGQPDRVTPKPERERPDRSPSGQGAPQAESEHSGRSPGRPVAETVASQRLVVRTVSLPQSETQDNSQRVRDAQTPAGSGGEGPQASTGQSEARPNPEAQRQYDPELESLWKELEDAVERTAGAAEANEGAEQPPVKGPSQEEPSEREKASKDSSPAGAERSGGKTPEIVVEVEGDNLILTSDDPKALDEVERWIQMLAQQLPEKTGWTVFYLRSADATEAAAMLERLFPESVVSTPSATTGVLGSLSRFGSNMLQSTGLSGVTSTETLQIIPETRLNALFVSGPPDKVRDVENVLRVLDASELPEQLRQRTPRIIQVQYADASQVAEVIRNVFAVEMQGEQQRPTGPFAAFGRGRPSGPRGPNQVRLTLGVDTSTNQIIVSCDESLYRQIEALVKELDRAAFEARQTVRVVAVQAADPEAVQQALTSMIPKVTITAGSSTTSTTTRSTSRTRSRTGSPGRPPFGGPPPDQLRAMMIQRMRQFLQGGGGRGFRPPGGSRGPSRFSPRSPFGGRRR